MPKFSIAFISPGNNLMHRITEAADQDAALRVFFDEINLASYSRDDEGYAYFKEDFFETKPRNGSVIPLEEN
jgi:hypothetical protein